MARFKVGAAVAASAFAAALACAGPASADTPDIDSPCAGHDLGRSATATNGKTVVCIADDSGRLTWMLDGGAASTIAGLQAQPGGAASAQAAGDAMIHASRLTTGLAAIALVVGLLATFRLPRSAD